MCPSGEPGTQDIDLSKDAHHVVNGKIDLEIEQINEKEPYAKVTKLVTEGFVLLVAFCVYKNHSNLRFYSVQKLFLINKSKYKNCEAIFLDF